MKNYIVLILFLFTILDSFCQYDDKITPKSFTYSENVNVEIPIIKVSTINLINFKNKISNSRNEYFAMPVKVEIDLKFISSNEKLNNGTIHCLIISADSATSLNFILNNFKIDV